MEVAGCWGCCNPRTAHTTTQDSHQATGEAPRGFMALGHVPIAMGCVISTTARSFGGAWSPCCCGHGSRHVDRGASECLSKSTGTENGREASMASSPSSWERVGGSSRAAAAPRVDRHPRTPPTSQHIWMASCVVGGGLRMAPGPAALHWDQNRCQKRVLHAKLALKPNPWGLVFPKAVVVGAVSLFLPWSFSWV